MAAGSSWTTERVLALAPDPAAARAGRGLASRAHWSGLGQDDTIVWGECRGSGGKPYQTRVTPALEATLCSCPSRKSPCKHALGLLLIWTESSDVIPSAEPPPWVTTGTRSAPKATSPRRVDPAARTKRESARLSKVAAGLDDLDRWIGDLVRVGFGTLGSRGPTLWDEQARRLVDAQCPGVARRFRQIEAMNLTAEGWQTALLDCLAQVNLLIEGFRHRDTLPAGVRADVWTAIGFPADLEGVRAGTVGTSVRDTWRVLGQGFAIEDKLTVRRTWLWGSDSHRSALLLDFAPRGQSFEIRFEPGTQVDATLGFFPSAAPLRALVVDQLGLAEPMDSLSGGVSIAEAHAAFGAMLARSPWVELIAVILHPVTLRVGDGGWSVFDPTGAWLPLSPQFAGGWQVEAASGGHPITLVAEFDGVLLNPIGAAVGRKYLPLSTPPGKARSEPADRWLTSPTALLSAATKSAIVGVDRKPPPSGVASSPVASIGAGVAERPAPARLLAIAAAAGLAARIGRQSQVEVDLPLESCLPGPEVRPECSPAAARRLRALFAGEFGVETSLSTRLFEEWFQCCARAGQRLPADLLVAVLELVGEWGAHRAELLAILGARGRWLAGRNPTWQNYGELPPVAELDSNWKRATRADRLALFTRLRGLDPTAARRLVEPTFHEEPLAYRTEVVQQLLRNLSRDDEPWLEIVLDDRNPAVRSEAAWLLRKIPDSRFCDRMAARVRNLLWWEGDDLKIEPPAERDEAMIRDVITRDNGKELAGQAMGEQAGYLHQILSMTPLTAITDHLGQPPATIIAAARRSRWAIIALSGWEASAVIQPESAWSLALIQTQLETGEYRTSDWFADLFQGVDPAVGQSLITDHLRAGPSLIWGTNPATRLISAAESRFSIDLSRAILREVEEILGIERNQTVPDRPSHWSTTYHELRTMIEGLDRKLPFRLVAEGVTQLARPLVECIPVPPMSLASTVAAMLDRWMFRAVMHQEFTTQ